MTLARGQRIVALGLLLAASPLAAQLPDSTRTPGLAAHDGCGACIASAAVGLHAIAVADTGRPHAIEYSDAYATRLRIHMIGSYVELPLFAAEYVMGQKLLNDTSNLVQPGQRPPQSSLRSWHQTVATGLGVLFATNTVTGVWNLVESRHDPAGRTRRWLHSLAMLAADAGFVATAQAGGDARRTLTGADHHRALAIGSMSLATASTLMMWLWKD